MNLEYKYLLNSHFHPDSKVWIYQGSRLFTMAEALEIEYMLQEFIKQWKSHGDPVNGAAYLFFGQFIILMADETTSGICGRSRDESMRMIKEIEQRFSVNLFDRTTFAFFLKDKVQLLPMSQLQYATDNDFINGDTLYFNNLVETKKELENNWIIPIKESWLNRKISLKAPVL
ncbi:MAG: hypothetical protein JST17_01260 [Bacteroidetes bacterium]|nr:hypothetical protein [Bacteroidota bacterium]MBS1931913.1 hypothetical protein [Bacteroidota bacterium]